MRAGRIDLGLLQKDVAVRMGVDEATVTNWELGSTDPEERFIPRLVAFLGYNPLPDPRTPGEAIRRNRLTLGLSLTALAARAGVDPAAVARLEANRRGSARRPTEAVLRVLGLGGKTPPSG